MTRLRDSYHHGDLRAALLDAGLALVEEDGLEGLSLRGVARRAGVSHAAPYHHFSDKAALLSAIAARGFDALDRDIRERRAGAPADRLQSAAVAYVGFAVEHPELFRLMFSGSVSPEADPELHAAASRAYAHITGPLGDEAPAVAAWSLVHGLAMLLLDAQIGEGVPTRKAAEERARAVTRVLWEGLRGHAREERSEEPGGD